MKRFLTIGVFILPLMACQTMTVAECEQGDWTRYGQEDGARGYADRWQTRTNSCLKQGVPVSSSFYQSYLKSYRQSIQNYCQKDNIFQQGLIGEARIDACPEPNKTLLKPIYAVTQRYVQNKRELDYVNKQIVEYELKLKSSSNNEEFRKLQDAYHLKRKEYQNLLKQQKQTEYEIDLIRP